MKKDLDLKGVRCFSLRRRHNRPQKGVMRRSKLGRRLADARQGEAKVRKSD